LALVADHHAVQSAVAPDLQQEPRVALKNNIQKFL